MEAAVQAVQEVVQEAERRSQAEAESESEIPKPVAVRLDLRVEGRTVHWVPQAVGESLCRPIRAPPSHHSWPPRMASRSFPSLLVQS